MPLCYGGGVYSIDQVKKLISLGVEKISICSSAVNDYKFLERAIKIVGSQSIVVAIDVLIQNQIYKVTTENGTKISNLKLDEYLEILEKIGVGEVLINSIDRDGAMEGYDLSLAEMVSKKISLPCTFLGGAANLNDISELLRRCELVGAAAGSLFIFKGPYNAVLVNYPSKIEKKKIFAISE
jgi:cyclase